MTTACRRLLSGLLAAVLVLAAGAWRQEAAVAGGCTGGGVEVDLAGSGDTAVVSGRAATACHTAPSPRPRTPQPYWSYEIACSPDPARAAEGLCSATPCKGGLYFAFRTLHHLDGRAEPAGYACVRLERARATPNLTAADVFAAVRRVRLPTGVVRTTPSGRGLANLASYFWLVGAAQAPVDLPLAGSVVHAEFQPVEYRWSFGSVSGTVPAVTRSGRDGAVRAVFPSRGRFAVVVKVTWSAAAFLDGRYVGQVDGLESTARTSYPVAELRTALSG